MRQLNRISWPIALSLLLGFSVSTLAQTQMFKLSEDDGVGPEIRDLNWLNSTFLAKQRARIDEITRSNFGRPIRNDLSDLIALQRVIDEELIPSDEKETLQALGVVLGDVYVKENSELEWKVYDDGQASHAVCLKNSENCLFPITMLSRRIEAGAKPKVNEVYEKGLDLLEPYLPKKPFQ